MHANQIRKSNESFTTVSELVRWLCVQMGMLCEGAAALGGNVVAALLGWHG
jgi:hypothetical protein